MRLEVDDPRLAWWAPRPPRRDPAGMRLERFPSEAATILAGQIGPLANLRSSTGCAVVLRTDSPWIVLHLERLRHHQPAAVGVDLEIDEGDGRWRTVHSGDLREHDGTVAVWLPTGLLPGAGERDCWLWLPLLSTALVAAIAVHPAATVLRAQLPEPRLLVLGDSLAQGFIVQQPTQNWVHRVARATGLPAWNLGIGGLRIEPALYTSVLAERAWDLVIIALGANHAWKSSDTAVAAALAEHLARQVCAGPHSRVAWLLPPWKPCEDGLGPPEFMGVPLDRAAGERGRVVRADLARVLAPLAPRLQLIEHPLPQDHRLLPDGLHPTAQGFALLARGLSAALGTGPT